MRQHGLCGRLAFLAGALCLSLTACEHGQPEAAMPPSGINQSADSAPQTSQAATTHPTTSGAVSANPSSFAALMQELNKPEQARVREWYRRIGGPSMNDATAAEVTWMRARHYPMPADIARAESISLAELKAAASTDTTAQILYVAKVISNYHHELRSGTVTDRVPIQLIREVSPAMPQILASGSPYAGYLFAAKDRLLHPGDDESNAAALLAGLVWASKFGDTRANRLLDAPSVQAVDASLAAVTMGLILNEALRANPTLFSTAVSPIPGPNH